MKRALDWVFKSRETGRITIWQWPNPPLWVWLAASVLANVVKNGPAHTPMSGIATVALAVWAVLEIVRGVNPFRRAVGALVLAGLLLRVFS